MTELLAPFGAPPDPVKQPADVEASPRTPVLITEQQVLFANAAAAGVRPARTGWVQAVRAFVVSAFAPPSYEDRPKRRHYPSRNDFLEDSRMSREMMRL